MRAILVFRQLIVGNYLYHNVKTTLTQGRKVVSEVDIEEGTSFLLRKDPSIWTEVPLEVHNILYFEN